MQGLSKGLEPAKEVEVRLRGYSLPVEHLSASSLAKGAACPEAFRRRYLLKEREQAYGEMVLGSVDHAIVAENFLNKMETGKDLEWSFLKKRYRELWDDRIEKEGEPNWNGASPEGLQETGLKMAETYLAECASEIVPVKVEERFELNLNGIGRPIIGYQDIQTKEKVIERKTTKSKVTTAKPLWRFQSKIYSLASDLPVSWHVITSQKDPKIYTGETEPGLFLPKTNHDETVKLIQQIAYSLNDLFERYGVDQQWPTLGIFQPWMCSRCSFQQTCPAWKLKAQGEQ